MGERMWMARHKPKSSGMSMSSASWRGPTRGHERHEAVRQQGASGSVEIRERDPDAGTRLREQALWLPVSENRLARSSRPGPDWCGAVLFEGGPSEMRSESPSLGVPVESAELSVPS